MFSRKKKGKWKGQWKEFIDALLIQNPHRIMVVSISISWINIQHVVHTKNSENGEVLTSCLCELPVLPRVMHLNYDVKLICFPWYIQIMVLSTNKI